MIEHSWRIQVIMSDISKKQIIILQYAIFSRFRTRLQHALRCAKHQGYVRIALGNIKYA